MSSILKALKKLEHEKVVRKPDSFRIDSEILRARSPRRFISPSGASLAAIALFLCGSGITYLSMRRHDVPVAFQPAQSPRMEVKAAPTTVVIRPPKTENSSTNRIPQQHAIMPHKNSRQERIGVPTTYLSETIAPRQSLPEKAPVSVPPVSVSNIVRPELTSPSPLTGAVTTAAPALIKVDGIAFQGGSANSAAVVNGTVVSKNSMIGGVKVEEIQKDRVRFSRGADKFEILLDK